MRNSSGHKASQQPGIKNMVDHMRHNYMDSIGISQSNVVNDSNLMNKNKMIGQNNYNKNYQYHQDYQNNPIVSQGNVLDAFMRN
jgi:hypothetical protein